MRWHPLFFAIAVLVPKSLVSHSASLLLLYVGPDQLLPLGSFLGAVPGFLLTFWNRIVNTFRRVRQYLSSRRRD